MKKNEYYLEITIEGSFRSDSEPMSRKDALYCAEEFAKGFAKNRPSKTYRNDEADETETKDGDVDISVYKASGSDDETDTNVLRIIVKYED